METRNNLTKFVFTGPECSGKTTLSSKIAKIVFDEMLSTGQKPDLIIDKKGLKQISDKNELTQMIEKILSENIKSKR